MGYHLVCTKAVSEVCVSENEIRKFMMWIQSYFVINGTFFPHLSVWFAIVVFFGFLFIVQLSGFNRSLCLSISWVRIVRVRSGSHLRIDINSEFGFVCDLYVHCGYNSTWNIRGRQTSQHRTSQLQWYKDKIHPFVHLFMRLLYSNCVKFVTIYNRGYLQIDKKEDWNVVTCTREYSKCSRMVVLHWFADRIKIEKLKSRNRRYRCIFPVRSCTGMAESRIGIFDTRSNSGKETIQESRMINRGNRRPHTDG